MKKNDILHNNGKSKELILPEISFEEDKEEKIKKEQMNNKEEYKKLFKSILVPNTTELNFKTNIILYLVLGIYFFIGVISAFTRKEFGNILGILMLTYITISITSKLREFENTRYMNIATWNLYNSLTMLIKAVIPELINNIDYAKFISFASITYVSSLAIGLIPSFSFLSITALVLLFIAYISAFCNKDFEIIKDSVKALAKIAPGILVVMGIIGGVFYGSDALNMAGYITWIIIYSIDKIIKEYIFIEV